MRHVGPTTPIPSQRTRASSVGKTSSFSFCQVDMYALTRKAILFYKEFGLVLFLQCPNQ